MVVSIGTRKFKEAARIILVGAPGVGKGTQSERLMRRYPQLDSISTGDLLRDNVRDKTSLGKLHPVTMSRAIGLTSIRIASKIVYEFWIACPRPAHSRPDS